jgi:hypothetical protein
MEDHLTPSDPAGSVDPWEATPRTVGPSREVLDRVFGFLFDDPEAPEGSEGSAGPSEAAEHASASDPPGAPD